MCSPNKGISLRLGPVIPCQVERPMRRAGRRAGLLATRGQSAEFSRRPPCSFRDRRAAFQDYAGREGRKANAGLSGCTLADAGTGWADDLK
jgi:hypothetical protein